MWLKVKSKKKKVKRSSFIFYLLSFPSPRGFSIIEVLMVIAMIGILSLTAAPYMSDILGKKNIDNYSLEAMDALREAQSSVMSGKNNARFGVHFEGTKFVLFQGATYSAADPNNVDHVFSGFATVTAVTLSPGGACALPAGTGNCDVHYASHFGTPTESGTVVITDGTSPKTVTVGAAGMVDVN
jgi:prepilin-type N-terminal cleavage/methylation domain-containing protein